MAMTYATLKYLTQYLVGDPQGSTYSDQHYQDAINFAIKDYAKKTGATYVEASVTPDANGYCTIPTGYIRINRVMYKVANTTVTEMVESSFNFESLKSSTWQSTTGVPKRWVLWDGAKVKLTPIPSPIYAATIGYVEDPTDLVYTVPSGTVDSRIPDAHTEYLKYAAGAWLKLLDGDAEDIPIANDFMNKFNSLIGYKDPVLEEKLAQARTQAIREV